MDQQSPSNATVPSREVFTNYSLPFTSLWATNDLGNDTVSFTVGTIDDYHAGSDIVMLYTDGLYETGAVPWAVNCTLYPCVRSYTARVVNGILNEEQTSADFDVSPTGTAGGFFNYSTAVDVGCLPAGQRQFLINHGYDISPNTTWIWYNGTDFSQTYNENSFDNITEEVTSKLNLDCMYGVYFASADAIAIFMKTYFNGSIIPDQSGFTGPSVVQQLYNQSSASIASVSLTMQNVAESMTRYMRQNGAQNVSSPAVGLVYHEDTCVHIRWGWLAFPAALICLSILFLVLMILDNARQPATSQDWKSSPLPLLFHGLDRDTVAQYDAIEPTEKSAMQDIAKAMRVRLGPSGQGWKFIKLD
jgi:hypothetical protein